MKSFKTVSLCFFFVLLLSQLAPATTLHETFKKQISVEPGGSVSVENTNGSIEVRGWDKSEVMIEAEKTAKGSGQKDAEERMADIDVEVVQNGNNIEIMTHLPRSGGSGFMDWVFGGGGGGTSVSYTIYVPNQTDLDLSSTNGAVMVKEVSGKIALHTTNGRIEANEVSGSVNANTTNGAITASFDKVVSNNGMEFGTTNGSITCYLPPEVQCDVRAKTTNGSIKSDFPLQIEGKYNSKRLDGEINGGGSLFEFRTTNGSIKIYKK